MRKTQRNIDILLVLMMVIQIALLVLRINDVVTCSWWLVFTPTFAPMIIMISLWIAFFFYFLAKDMGKKRNLRNRLKEVQEVKDEIKGILKEVENGKY